MGTALPTAVPVGTSQQRRNIRCKPEKWTSAEVSPGAGERKVGAVHKGRDCLSKDRLGLPLYREKAESDGVGMGMEIWSREDEGFPFWLFPSQEQPLRAGSRGEASGEFQEELEVTNVSENTAAPRGRASLEGESLGTMCMTAS